MGYGWLILVGQELDAEELLVVKLITNNKNLHNFYWHFSVLLPDPLCCRFIAIFKLTLQWQCNLLCVSWLDWYYFFTSPVSKKYSGMLLTICVTLLLKKVHNSAFFKKQLISFECRSCLRSLSKEMYFVRLSGFGSHL